MTTPLQRRSLEDVAEWVVRICLDFGALPETAHLVAAEFVRGIRAARAKTLADIWPGATVTGDPPFFRFDVEPEATSKENWGLYCEIQEHLRGWGWEISDPCVEHDCISGPLTRVDRERARGSREPGDGRCQI